MVIENKRRVKEFLQAIFEETKGYVELRIVGLRGRVGQRFYPTTDIDLLISDFSNADLVAGFFKNASLCFGVCPRRERRGREEDVAQVNCLWVDIDCQNDKERQKQLEKLKNFNPPPSILVSSGRGYHAYWLLKTPVPINKREDLLCIKGYVKGLSTALGADSTFDLSRVLRVPGTWNLKDPQNPRPVEILELHPSRRYELKPFEQYKVEIEDVTNQIEVSLGQIPDRFWQILEEDGKLKATWEGKRPDLEDQSRSGYDMALANLLMPYGFSDGEIGAIIKTSPSGRKEGARPQYLALTIGKARTNWPEGRKIVSRKIKDIEKGRKKHSSKSKFNPRPYSKEVLANHGLKYDKYKRFWIYDGNAGIWKTEVEVRLNSILRKKILGPEDYKRHCVGEIIDDLKGLTFVDEQMEEPEAHLIPFKNKVYDLRNDDLLDYSPEYFFINKLVVGIDKENKKCPTIDRIFEQLVAPEDVDTLYEIAAYTLYRGYPYPKLFILYGKGGNGKTTYVNILERFVGIENMSSVSLSDLQYNRFAPSELFGKLVNVSGEMDYAILKKTSKLKECCGGDLMRCERKFREPFPFRNYGKMIFLTNEIPPTADKSRAFYRRLFLVEFPNEFILGKDADPMIVKKIPQKELEGLAWKSLAILKKLQKKDFVFTRHPRPKDVKRQYEDLSNPLDKFLAKNSGKDVNAHIPVGELNEKYRTHLEKNGVRVWTEKQIGQAMREKGFVQKPVAFKKGDGKWSTCRAWLGIKWK